MSKPILFPPKTLEQLEALLMQKQAIDAQVAAIVTTARECMGVPDDYTIGAVRLGFVPPAEYIEVPDN